MFAGAGGLCLVGIISAHGPPRERISPHTISRVRRERCSVAMTVADQQNAFWRSKILGDSNIVPEMWLATRRKPRELESHFLKLPPGTLAQDFELHAY